VFNRISGGEHEPRHPIAAAFVDAAMRCGYQQQSLAHWDIGEGVGWLNITSRGGVRQSASVSYLHPLTGLPANLRLRTEVFAEKVVFNDKGRAIGVLAGGETLAARREVVLCAGAIGSAKLLLLSGVGPAQHLRDLGIDVVADSAGVGENLQDHVEGLVMVEASRPFPKPTSHGWEAAVFACSEPDMAAPDIQIHFGTEGYDMNTRELGMPSPEYAVTLAPNVARPASRGTVQLRSPDPTAPPRVDPRYFSDADGHDERVMLAAMRVARRIAATSPLQDWLGLEIAPGSGAQSDQDVLAFLRQAHGSVFHPAGTCRIGAASDPRAVVDPSLRVYGVTALRVADASVFPTLVGVNPCVTSMMVGERAASLIRARSLSISEE
jgi:choline dehydrogenase-like flavoprotein